MKTVLVIYITAILVLIGGLIYIDHELVKLQNESYSEATYTPLVLQPSNRQIVPTEAYQGGQGYGRETLQPATVTIE